MQPVRTYLLLINALGLGFMSLDKYLAQTHRRRIPESALLTVAAVGGALGSLLGMYLVRHKTRHPKFYLGVPALLALHIFLYHLLRSSVI